MTSPARSQIPTLVLESLDGTLQIRLDAADGWIRMPGSTGLEMPPYETISQSMPGVVGSTLTDVRVNERPIFIPIYCGGNNDPAVFREMMNKLFTLVNPRGRRTFRLVGENARGSREMIVSYVSGLEGADGAMEAGLSWAKLGLNLVAHQAFAQAREERTLEFRTSATASPFLGAVGGSDAPWPRPISTTSVIGEGMAVIIDSEEPVYPVVELVGPMTSFHGDLTPVEDDDDPSDDNWSIDIPAGITSTQTFRMVTDPRIKSFRLNGALAAGRVALGSRLGPFYPGENTLNVAAPGSTTDTRIRLSWRNLYRSIWA